MGPERERPDHSKGVHQRCSPLSLYHHPTNFVPRISVPCIRRHGRNAPHWLELNVASPSCCSKRFHSGLRTSHRCVRRLGRQRGLAAPWRGSNQSSGGRIVQWCFCPSLNTSGEAVVSNDPESPSVWERDSLSRGRGHSIRGTRYPFSSKILSRIAAASFLASATSAADMCSSALCIVTRAITEVTPSL